MMRCSSAGPTKLGWQAAANIHVPLIVALSKVALNRLAGVRVRVSARVLVDSTVAFHRHTRGLSVLFESIEPPESRITDLNGQGAWRQTVLAERLAGTHRARLRPPERGEDPGAGCAFDGRVAYEA